MFTGIIEEKGEVRSISSAGPSARLTVKAGLVLQGTSLGDSIAVNGVCLTVTDLSNDAFTADVMHETLDRSSLGSLRSGSVVNLERAMTMERRFGGTYRHRPHRRNGKDNRHQKRRKRHMVHNISRAAYPALYNRKRISRPGRYKPHRSRSDRQRFQRFRHTSHHG